MSQDNFKAFPYTGAGSDGMDLRDYFAAKAMAVLITHPYIEESTKEEGVDQADFVSYLSYQVADAMMKERDEAA
jgi:hypothetical protein